MATFRAAGAASSGLAVAITVAAPAGVATGDLEILVAATIAGGTVTLSTRGGSTWTALGNIDVSLGEKLYAWWRIRQPGDTDPQVTPGSDHSIAIRLAYTVGTFDPTNPIEIFSTSTEVTSDTTFSWAPGTSTTKNSSTVLCIASNGTDTATAQVPVMTNASLTALASRANINTANGGGGGFGITEGTLATAGSIGTFATTYVTASSKAYMAFAIRPLAAWPNTLTTEITADSPIGWWRMDDAAGSLSDSRGSYPLSVFSAGALYHHAPLIPKAAASSFSMDNNFAATGEYESTTFPNPQAGDFTVEAWVTPLDFGITQRWCGIGGAGLNGWSVGQQWSDSWMFTAYGVSDVVFGNIQVNGNTYHITFVYHSAAHTVDLYQNGVFSENLPVGGGIGATVATLRVLANQASEYFHGYVDELAIYGSALSAARIAAHYQAAVNGPTDVPAVAAVRKPNIFRGMNQAVMMRGRR